MNELEQKISSVMNDPDMMKQIMALAQSMGGSGSQEACAPQPQSSAPLLPDIDLSMVQKLSGFAKKSGIDQNQKALLQALRPYLSNHRINRLEKAMQAAKMAGFATSLLGR